MINTVLPVIPLEEYPQRWLKVQEMMDREKLDLLIAYADDHAVYGPAHARWLANFPVHFEPVCVLMHREGQPVMLCGPESIDYIQLIGQIPDVRILKEFTHPDEDYLHTKIESLAEVTADIMKIESVRRVGIAGGDLMSFDVYQAFRNAFPSAEWVDAEYSMCILRSVKSPAELEVIRYAYQIAEIGLQAAINTIRVGITEREVAAAIEAEMRHAGAEGTGIDTMVGAGPNSRPLMCRSTFRKIEKNDLVQVTVAPRYEGYHAAIGRPVLVGSVGEQVMQAVDAALTAQKASSQSLIPGIKGRHAEGIGRKIMKDAGYEQNFLYSGIHSVGVIEFEAPIFGPTSKEIVEEGMVLSIDIPVFNTSWGGFRIEDGYLITSSGVEQLNRTEYKIEKSG
jgi:Xaa-Pro aminopeptidase